MADTMPNQLCAEKMFPVINLDVCKAEDHWLFRHWPFSIGKLVFGPLLAKSSAQDAFETRDTCGLNLLASKKNAKVLRIYTQQGAKD